jgi:hypothetical protein
MADPHQIAAKVLAAAQRVAKALLGTVGTWAK